MKRFKASYYGFIVADALGVPIKDIPREVLINNPVTSMLGYGNYNVPKGSWSSNTSALLATMDSVSAKQKIDYKDMATKLLEWINNSKYTSVDNVFGMDSTTLKAIERYKSGIKPLEAGMEGINYNSNHCLMRMMPIAYYIWNNNLSESEIIDLVFDVSSITHRHEISCLGCYIYVKYMLLLLEGHDKYTSYIKIKQLDYSSYEESIVKKYHRILEDNIVYYNLNDILSNEYIINTLEAVIWCINNTDSFKEAVIGAINLGDDTAGTAALVGSLAGIIYGYEAIDKNWISQLQKRDYINLMMNLYLKALNNIKGEGR